MSRHARGHPQPPAGHPQTLKPCIKSAHSLSATNLLRRRPAWTTCPMVLCIKSRYLRPDSCTDSKLPHMQSSAAATTSSPVLLHLTTFSRHQLDGFTSMLPCQLSARSAAWAQSCSRRPSTAELCQQRPWRLSGLAVRIRESGAAWLVGGEWRKLAHHHLWRHMAAMATLWSVTHRVLLSFVSCWNMLAGITMYKVMS